LNINIKKSSIVKKKKTNELKKKNILEKGNNKTYMLMGKNL
jgi:hypothetical protein